MKIEKLSVGSHVGPEQGSCINEYVSFLAKEKWSDRPACMSRSISSFTMWINDKGGQKHRDKLMLMAPRLLDTVDFSKEAARAAIFSEFAFWNAEKAQGFAKSAKSAKYAKYAESAAEYAEFAKYAEFAAEHAESAAESATESTAKYAEFRVECYDKAIQTLEKVLAV